MAQHSSLLHRLLTLLDTGSTQVTRFTAARQIGEIAKSHSQDLISILKKILQYLRSRNWDTRVAAAHALGAIAENVRHTSLIELMSSVESEMLEVGIDDVSKVMGMLLSNVHPENISGLSFISFDINKVLEFGSMLLASAGQEFDITSDTSKTPAERLARQKQSLRRRLGLDVCEQFMDVSDMIKDEDLLAPKCNLNGNGPNSGYHVTRSGQNIQQLVAAMVPGFRPRRLSARELNLLKRKAKVSAKDHTKYLSEDDELEMSASQHSVASKGSLDKPEANKDFVAAVIHVDKDVHDEDGRWPFQHFVDQLIHDMFDPVWEVRHGSIMALREILSHHGACVGVLSLDFNLEKSFFGDVEGRKRDEITGESLEFDLNVQFSADEHEPALKRHKSANGLNYFRNNIYLNESVDGEIKHGDSTETSSEINVNPALINGDTVGPHVKVEMEPSPDYLNFHCKVEDDASFGSSVEDSCSISNSKIFLDLPSTSKLKKLIKLARYSRMKNWEFLQDCAIRFLCILSLDRFGDYVADQVVAPVRETCAQALGVVLKYMHPSLVIETLRILLHMQCRQEWEVRHGCLLGIKYLVAVRKEMLQDLLPYILPACKAGLEDPDDDVRAVAADSLIPAAAAIVSLSDNVLHSIVMLLWDILLDLDDLSPSTSSVMNLLSEIYSQPEMAPKMLGTLKADKECLDLNQLSQGRGDVAKYGDNPYVLSKLTPRLWPFMRHSITSVRHSAIRTLERLLEVGNRQSSSESLDNGFWPAAILGDALRIVFQNLLLESNDAVLSSSERVWRLLLQCPEQDLEAAAKLYFSSWMHLAATPYGSALDASKMFWPTALPRKSHFRAAAKMRVVMGENDSDTCLAFNVLKGNLLQEKNRIDAATISPKIIVGADSDKSVTHTRTVTASALGIFVSRLPIVSVPIAIYPIWNDLTSFSGVQRQVASMVLVAWFKELLNHDCENAHGNLFGPLKYVKNWLLDLLGCSDPSVPTKNSLLPYSELSRTYAKMRNEANILFRLAKSCSRLQSYISALNFSWDTLSIDEAISFTSKLSETIDSVTIEKTIMNELESAKQQLLSTTGYLKCVQNNLHITVSSMAAAALVWMSDLPAKLNPVILPLMAAVKREQEELLQQKAAEALAELIYSCIGRKPGPNDKLVKNLCILTCSDTLETPQAAHIGSMDVILEDSNLFTSGRLPSIQKSRVQLVSSSEDRSKLEGFICRRGAELTLKHLCEKLGPSLFHKIPKLWDCLVEVLKPVHSDENIHNLEILEMSTMIDLQILINNIQLLRSITPFVDESLKQRLLTLLPSVLSYVRHYHVAVRLAASRCIASMAKSMTTNIMRVVIEKAIPMLADSSSLHGRQGAGMLVTLLVQGLGLELVPYAPLLVVPLLKCMNDCDFSVRQGVTHSFAALVPLLPLARGVPPPSGLSESLSRNTEDAQFLEQLLDNSHIDDYKLPIDIKMNLRRYQQEGINWLSFLRRFKLHGILCDDMGLGKTLQASAIVAADLAEQRATNNGKDPLSLIICPSTLVGHWAYEIDKYIDKSVMLTIQYAGSVSERIPLRGKFDKYNIIITSYDIVRKDIDFLGKLDWNYCILDEGHIIKNSKSKITHAVKQLKAEHRLILSGTPIQNNVLELWSLFDFLMPGFLGTEKQFQATYGKPLLAAKDSKCSAKDAEAGVLAMEALHKQVMPFLLRRTKDEVLSDLPEKIIQDRYCNLSPVQLRLYEQFSTSDSKREISSLVTESEAASEVEKVSLKASCHVFQALQYLLKLCSHPLLVIGEKPSESMKGLLAETVPDCSDILLELHGLHHSPKLVALQEILEECGIGINTVSSEDAVSVGQHRVLIFAQHRSLLDIIERDLFHTHMKSVTYLRLDGSVEPDKRFEIVKTFNSDPTIDVLLLTTHVGGLGLNLTSADTLVFMEHDWNPMKDHQAMDRAHRLGQRKVVNVHRIIMRGTLEEKIMSLQKFKISVANAVINAENASMKTMNTDQLLDLFTPVTAFGKIAGSDGGRDEGTSAAAGKKGLKAILSGLEELWDQSQYSEEYDLSHFLGKLNNA